MQKLNTSSIVFLTLVICVTPEVTWHFHFPLQYFSITTFYISPFSHRSRIRSAAQQSHHLQNKKEKKNVKHFRSLMWSARPSVLRHRVLLHLQKALKRARNI